MIITKKKDFEELYENIKIYRSFFLLGCSECATLCGTGGESEVSAMKNALESMGKIVTGILVLKTGCQVLGTRVELKPFRDAIQSAECIIVMSCGAGTQTVVELYDDKPVCPANDSMFLGNMTRFQMFDERCSLCGKCIIDKTGGICPVTRCPKGLLHGPCGGMKDGHCEVSNDLTCAWILIYERMKKLDMLNELRGLIMEPKEWSRSQRPKTQYGRSVKENR